MVLNKQDKDYKEYLKLSREYSNVTDAIRAIPYKDVVPYQRGWVLTFDLRDDISRRKDAPMLRKLLHDTHHAFTTTSVNLVRRVRQLKGLPEIMGDPLFAKETTYRGFKSLVREAYYLSLSPEERKYFYESTEYTYYRGKGKFYRCDIPRHWIICKIKPNMITRARGIDGELESKYHKLREQLWLLWSKYLRGDKLYRRTAERMEIRDKIQKFMKNEIEDDQLHVDVFWDWG